MEEYFILYKTTNLINGKKYRGSDKEMDLLNLNKYHNNNCKNKVDVKIISTIENKSQKNYINMTLSPLVFNT